MGLTPKDHSTAGKVRLGVITRAGDEALRQADLIAQPQTASSSGYLRLLILKIFLSRSPLHRLMRVVAGPNGASPDWYVTVGYSFRFDRLF
jgi:transposase